MSWTTVGTAIALSTLALASMGHAQGNSTDEEARGLFEAGRSAYDAGRFESALDYFQRAYDLSHRGALLFNIASSADRLQDNARALQAYRSYVQAMPDAPNRELAESRIRFLEARVNQPAATGPTAAPPTSTHTPLSTTSPSHGGGGGDITGEWWFWTLIGVLVVGAAVGITAGIVASSGGVEQPLPGSVGQTFTLLTWGE